MTQFVNLRTNIKIFNPNTTNTTTAAIGYAHVAAARAGHPTSIIFVCKPNVFTIFCTLGPT